MSQKINIAEIKIIEGDNEKGHWKRYTIIGNDKTVLNTFDTSASSLKVGDIIDAELELKGKYINIKSFQISGHSTTSLETEHDTSRPKVAGQTDKNGQGQSIDIQRQSIETQVAIKTIAGLRIADKLTDDSLEYQGVLKWCRERIGVDKTTIKSETIPTITDTQRKQLVDQARAVWGKEGDQKLLDLMLKSYNANATAKLTTAQFDHLIETIK